MMTVKRATPGYVVVTDEDNKVWEVRITRRNDNGSVFHPPASSVSTLLNKVSHGLWVSRS